MNETHSHGDTEIMQCDDCSPKYPTSVAYIGCTCSLGFGKCRHNVWHDHNNGCANHLCRPVVDERVCS